MDYLAYAKMLFSVTHVPTVLYKDGHVIYSAMADQLNVDTDDSWRLYAPDRNPEISAVNPNLEYGHVQIEGTGYDLFFGPVFTTQITEQLIREFFLDAKIPADQQESVAEYLYGMPVRSQTQFVRLLLFVHLCLNGTETGIDEFYAEQENRKPERNSRVADNLVEHKENERPRSSYEFETKLYHLVEQGEPQRLKTFLERTQVFPPEGTLAHSPLRQAKNTMIGVAAKVCICAAIPAGIPAEQAYLLADMYTLECEQAQTIDEVHSLQYIMLMDFCGRCGNAKIPDGISAEVWQSMTYIQNHTNAPVSLEDVACQVHRSTSYLMRRFKAELNMSIGEYITKCKLEEACSLLSYSDRSLAEISAYLCYSSQSYFQNVFKKQYGMTPMQYRRKYQKTV